MFKKLIIIIGIVVGVAAIVAIWLHFQNANSSSASNLSAPETPNPGKLPLPAVPSQNTVTIGTSQGNVAVNNFYKTVTSQDEEYVTFEQSSDYELLYDTEDSSFVVSILNGPIAQTVPEAEQAFLGAVGVSKSDACKLNVTVGIPAALAGTQFSEGLPLSFCPSGTSL